MLERTLRVLEYEKILERLAERTASALGRQLAEILTPSNDRENIEMALRRTSEARNMMTKSLQLPLSGIFDLRESIAIAALGRSLNAEELLKVGNTLDTVGRIVLFFKEHGEDYPTLFQSVLLLKPFPRIVKGIFQAIGPGGEILDDASPRLRTVRHQIRTLHRRVKERLESMIKSSENQKYLQENLVTIRNGRYVIPVKQEHKGIFPGIVHDQSASGATLFIEPIAIVEFNNQLRQFELQEQEEIERILAMLSGEIAGASQEIATDLDVLGQLDLTVAKARLSFDYDGTEPTLNDSGYIHLKSARHPLLTGKVVPIDLELGGDVGTLVITGPNTGGKTVSLKTLGLLALMAQSGMHIPARYDSELPIFRGIYSDIGDEQSIEQSLSTFSSHMVQIVTILNNAQSEEDLVLLDELGAGTDPAEGAALAMAILSTLHGRGVRTVATTHYSELKAFAYNTPGIQNASVEFDLETLRPTYRLLQGLPGRSNAFAIAERLGLSGTIIRRAQSILSPDQLYVEELIGRITEDQKRLDEDRRVATELRTRLEKQEKQMRMESEQLRMERVDLLRQAKDEARTLLRETRREMERLLREMREAAPEEQSHLAGEIRKTIEAKRQGLEEEPEASPKRDETCIERRNYQIGDTVKLIHMGQTGVILELAQSQAQVQVGAIKLWVELNQLNPSAARMDKNQGSTTAAALGREKAETISPEMDLRGSLVEDALLSVDKYLDEAFLVGLKSIRLIHGKGTGALRTAIGEHLKTHPHVARFRWGRDDEGGMGVTVVELRS